MTVYLGWYEKGEYEDYEQIFVGVYATRELALAHAEQALREQYEDWCEDTDNTFEGWCEYERAQFWTSASTVQTE